MPGKNVRKFYFKGYRRLDGFGFDLGGFSKII